MRFAVLVVALSMLVGCNRDRMTMRDHVEPHHVSAAMAHGGAAAKADPVATTSHGAIHHDIDVDIVPRHERDPYSPLSVTVAALGEEVAWRSPGTSLGISVHVLGEEERAEHNADAKQEPASAVKIVWAAAALKHTSIEAVAPHGEPAIVVSSNCSAASLIALAGGVEDVNGFYERAGMHDSGVRHWGAGGCSERKLASDSNERGNRLTAHDGVSFLDRLLAGALIPAEKTEALLSWMRTSPRTGTGGWLSARLPESVRKNVMHKAGWTEKTTNELGLVTTASNKIYTVALLATAGRNMPRQQAFLAYASCAIYQAIEGGDATTCE